MSLLWVGEWGWVWVSRRRRQTGRGPTCSGWKNFHITRERVSGLSGYNIVVVTEAELFYPLIVSPSPPSTIVVKLFI